MAIDQRHDHTANLHPAGLPVQRHAPLPSYFESVDYLLDGSRKLHDETALLTRERARYEWLAEQIIHWSWHYDVAQLVALLRTLPTMPGQHARALVALSLHESPDALAALLAIQLAPDRPDLDVLRQICLGAWHWESRKRGVEELN